MVKLIELKTKDIPMPSQIINKTMTDEIYLVLPRDAILTVKKNSYVKIGSKVCQNYNLTSPLSGFITSITKINTINGSYPALKIINDFQENKTHNPKSIVKLTKEDLTIAFDYFHLKISSSPIIINAIDDEPYVYTNNYYLLSNYEKYLELLDKIATIYNQEVIICLKETDPQTINNILTLIGMYPQLKLKVLPPLYLLGQNKILKEYLELPSPSLALTTSMLDNLLSYLRYHEESSSFLLTIKTETQILLVRLLNGTPIEYLQDILPSSKDYLVYANGLMQGHEISLDNLVLTKDINSLIFTPKTTLPKEGRCLNCAACSNICPVGLNPKLFSNPTYLSKARLQCLKCNLCTYICPAYINFNKYLKEEE